MTIGILIALGLEAVVEWRHHVALASEARENILSEIRDNRRELEDVLKTTPKVIADQKLIVQLANDLLTKHNTAIHSVSLNFRRADLSKTSWSTAQSVSAISYMPYQEVKAYANVYELQDEYVRLEERTIDAGIAAIASLAQNEDPAKLQESQLRLIKETVLTSMSDLTAETQIGEALRKRYSQVLSKSR